MVERIWENRKYRRWVEARLAKLPGGRDVSYEQVTATITMLVSKENPRPPAAEVAQKAIEWKDALDGAFLDP